MGHRRRSDVIMVDNGASILRLVTAQSGLPVALGENSVSIFASQALSLSRAHPETVVRVDAPKCSHLVSPACIPRTMRGENATRHAVMSRMQWAPVTGIEFLANQLLHDHQARQREEYGGESGNILFVSLGLAPWPLRTQD
jgi:hypothetical protein